jgi:lipid II:glycine glycyltransferase (peptidoglycan interpeptide bridge formation enzyme)
MSQETFAICKIAPPFSRQFLGEMWRQLHTRGRVIALSAFHEGVRIATLMLPFDGQTMYYWGGASYIKTRGIPAHNLLHWEAIKLGLKLGLRRYDFVSTLGNGGRFKKTFGPQAIHMATHWERTSSGIVRLLRHGYERYCAVRQRLHRWELSVSRVIARLFTLGLMLSPVGL